MTHTEAATKFKKCHNKERGYRLAKHTRLQKRGGAFVVKYYDTDIVTIRPDGTYRLNSNGRKSITTKVRMSEILPKQICQSMGIWYINKIPYYDGMLIDANGIPISPHKMKDIKKIKQKVDKKFIKFLNLMFDKFFDNIMTNYPPTMTVPRLSSKTYAKNLWTMVIDVLEFDKIQRKSKILPHNDIWIETFSSTKRDKLIVFSIFHQNYNYPHMVWKNININILNKVKSARTKNIVLSFLRQRKVLIAEMIANGEIK